MSKNIFYLQGPDAHHDAIFIDSGDPKEGLDVICQTYSHHLGSIDGRMPVTGARQMWKFLVDELGWHRVKEPRRSYLQIRWDLEANAEAM